MSTASLPVPAPRSRLARMVKSCMANRVLKIALPGWVVLNAVIALLAWDTTPIDRPLLDGQSGIEQLVVANVAMAEVLVLIAIVLWLTRNRDDSTMLTPSRAIGTAGAEILMLATWGVLAIFGGIALGQAMETAPIGFHLAGTIFGVHDHDVVTRQVALMWATYNLIVYAVIPFLYVRQRAGTAAMPLRSLCRRGDIRVIMVILAIETVLQMATVSSRLLGLDARQLAIGVPLTFALYFAGTVLPTAIFIQALLVPRLLALTGSAPAAVVLGGIAYTAVHASDSWMVTTSPGNLVLSFGFLVLTYIGPGMIKAVMTIRTGNAWVHAWGYHALAPHTLIDTPLVVRIFGI